MFISRIFGLVASHALEAWYKYHALQVSTRDVTHTLVHTMFEYLNFKESSTNLEITGLPRIAF